MAVETPPGPRKPFREEAQASTVQCPACGGPLTLRGFGGIEHVVCPYCGSASTPAEHGALRVLAEVTRRTQRARRTSVLPLYRRGTFEGAPWEILGIVWRECRVDGEVYPWQEFLLYNPYRGYRYLVFTMYDQQWSIGEPLAGAPSTSQGFGHRTAVFRGKKYKHFQSVTARVTYVEGEFPWQVHVGDDALTHEYIAPPASISVEETRGDDGQDIAFTMNRYVSAEEVWKAFGMPGTPPRPQGIAPNQPNPWVQGSTTTWLSLAALLLLWSAVSLVYVQSRTPKDLFRRTQIPIAQGVHEEIEIVAPRSTTLELEMRAYPLSNAWASFDVVLAPHDRDTGLAFGVLAEYWHGYSDGEAWQEGDVDPVTVLGNIEPGRYLLEITPSASSETGEITTGLHYDVVLRQDVVLLRYVFLALGVILTFPFLYWLMGRFFEGRRWSNSDYAASE